MEDPRIIASSKSEGVRALPDTEQTFRSLVENSPAGIFTVDDKFHFIYGNDKLAEVIGYPLDEIIGSDFRKFLSEGSKQMVVERYVRRQKGESVPPRYEIDVIHKNGEMRHLELSSAVIRDEQGKVKTVGQVLDITERRHAEEELIKAQSELEERVLARTSELKQANELLRQEIAQRKQAESALAQSEVRYRHLIENTNCIILEWDTGGNVTFLNKFGQNFFGYSEEEILSKNVIGTIVPPRDTSGRDLEAMIKDIVIHPEKYRHNENENMKRSGEKVWIVWRNQPLFDEENSLSEILSIGIDRTAEKQAEEEKDREEKEKAAAAERSRLARDLHDAVSQTLFSASLIADVLPRLWEKDQEEGRRRLKEIRELTRGALAEMRTLLLELRPSALADSDLPDLLRQLGESITGRARVFVSLSVKGDCKVPTDVKIALYRIAQEALNNVAKHAEAKNAEMFLSCEDSRMTLVIRDNGKGFDADSIPLDSLGLGIMEERARSIGAEVGVKSRSGRGTEVTVSLDLSRRKE